MSTPAEPAIDLRPGEASAVARAPRKRRFSRAVRETGLGYMLLLPAFLIFSVFVFYPFLRNFYPREIVVEPLPNFPVIRDLVIDMSDFMHKLSAVKPWIIREHEKPLSEGEYLQTEEQIDLYHQYSACINCMLCYAACPVYALEPEFLGPAAIALARRYNLDSRDQGKIERLRVLATSEGIWDCTFVGECSVVCPKNVDPAKAIQQSKLDTTIDWYKRLLLPWTR